MRVRSSPPAEFGALLRQLRVAAELSQEELAQRARISADAIGALERGRRKAPQRETVDLLLAALQPDEKRRAALLAAANRARLRNAVPGAAETASHPSLPRPVSALVGRDAAVAEIGRMLRSVPLVTVAGAGGIGKTRVALEVAARQIDDWPDGVWFVELATTGDAALLAGTILLGVGGLEVPGETALEALMHHLRNKRTLLLLDNCEHLIDDIARIVERILRERPQTTLLATSREPLRVDGEGIYRLLPLEDASAAALFVQRARAADPAFSLTGRNAAAVAEICRRLDGVPLAIELAAARLRAISLPQLARGLDERFAILKDGNRAAAPRQQTMEALIDWSYDLLTDEERRFLRALAVFAGGCTVEAAAAVSAVTAGDAAAMIASLVDKSLVVAQPAGDERRYTLLDSMRAYASQKLDQAGERNEISHRYLNVVAELIDSIDRADRVAEGAAVTAEMENVRAALSWCVATGQGIEQGARLLTHAALLYTQRLYGEFLTFARYFLDRADRIEPAVVAAIWLGVARRAVGAPALDAADQAIAVLEGAGARDATLVRAHLKRAQALAQQARIAEALDENSKVLALRDAICPHDAVILASTHHQRGFILGQMGESAAARAEYQTAATVYDSIGDANGAAYMRGNSADCYYREGDVGTAERLTRESLSIFRNAHNWDGEAFALCNLAEFEIVTGNLPAAAASVGSALEAALRLASETWLAVTSLEAAALAAHAGDFRSAARLFGYVRAWREERAYREAGDARIQSSIDDLLRDGLPPQERALLQSNGAALREPEIAALILNVVEGV
jgi:predicted ATPase/DNA-binding XRE family transcriptional regulator